MRIRECFGQFNVMHIIHVRMLIQGMCQNDRAVVHEPSRVGPCLKSYTCFLLNLERAEGNFKQVARIPKKLSTKADYIHVCIVTKF